jgi:hypothetical protein
LSTLLYSLSKQQNSRACKTTSLKPYRNSRQYELEKLALSNIENLKKDEFEDGRLSRLPASLFFSYSEHGGWLKTGSRLSDVQQSGGVLWISVL